MKGFKGLACLCILVVLLTTCAAPSQPRVEQGLLNAENPEVFVRAGAVTPAPTLPGRVAVANGASIGALQNAVGRYSYGGCLDLLIFGATNGAKMDVKDDSAGNYSSHGSQLVGKSSDCPSITITSDGNPPEARVSTIGTVFFVAYDPDKHITLLWTLVGTAALTNIQANGQSGETTGVPNGFWSVVRDRAEPESPQPVAQMGPIIDELGLRDIYDLIVEIMEKEGFGSSAPGPQNIATIVPPTATPTPTRVPTRIPTNTATNIPPPTVTRPPTATRTRVIIPANTATTIPSATATNMPLPTFTPLPTTTPFISFRADRTTINQGESTILRWDVDSVREVYFDGQGVGGHSSRTVQPSQTQTYTLRVVPQSGPDQYIPLTITVIPVVPRTPVAYGSEASVRDPVPCFDFDFTRAESVCTVGDDIVWTGDRIESWNNSRVSLASPQSDAYESCSNVNSKVVMLENLDTFGYGDPNMYICVRTTDNRVAVMHITHVEGSYLGSLLFDWVLY